MSQNFNNRRTRRTTFLQVFWWQKKHSSGICGYETIMSNHSPLNISYQAATSGNLEGNPIHIEALEAAQN